MALGWSERKKNQSDAFFGSLISNKAVTAYQESSHGVSWLTVQHAEADRYKTLRNKWNGINKASGGHTCQLWAGNCTFKRRSHWILKVAECVCVRSKCGSSHEHDGGGDILGSPVCAGKSTTSTVRYPRVCLPCMAGPIWTLRNKKEKMFTF